MNRLPLLAFGAACFATLTLTSRADIYNRVTLSGKVTYATDPVTTHTNYSTSTVSKLATVSITNASILEAMVQASLLPTKTGYALVETMANDGTSNGFFAFNSKTGDTVALDPSLFAGLSNPVYVSAINASAHMASSGPVLQTHVTSNTGVGQATLLGGSMAASFTGSTTLRNSVIKSSDGTSVSTPYTAVTYAAVLQGMSPTTQYLSAKLSSAGSVYYTPAPLP